MLGVANVLLVPYAGVTDVELLFMLFGWPEFGEPEPLSEWVTAGVPYPLVLVVAAGDFVVGVASVLLLCAKAPPDNVSAATAAINVLVALFMTCFSLVGLE